MATAGAETIDERAAFARLLRQARLAANMTQRQVSDAVDAAESTVRNWEGARALPEYHQQLRLCVLFGWPHPALDLTGPYLGLRTLNPRDLVSA